MARDRVTDLRFDGEGALWVAAQGGASRVKNGRITSLSSRNGLPCDTVFWTIEDDERSLWLYMPCGLVRIARAELDAWLAAGDPAPPTPRGAVFGNFDRLASPRPGRGVTPPPAPSRAGEVLFASAGGCK